MQKEDGRRCVNVRALGRSAVKDDFDGTVNVIFNGAATKSLIVDGVRSRKVVDGSGQRPEAQTGAL